jgi:hypothetical protein
MPHPHPKISPQTIESVITALTDIRDGLEEQLTVDDEKGGFLQCEELTDRDFINSLIIQMEDYL